MHVDPGAGWFPHFLGFEDETGTGAGEGANRNVTLAARHRRRGLDGGRRRTSRPGRRAHGARGARGGARRGRRRRRSREPARRDRAPGSGPRAARSGALGLPTVVVQEGGYDLDEIGRLVLEALAGIEEGAHG